MKKFRILVTIFLSITLIQSCQKEFSTTLPAVIISHKLKTYTESTTSSTSVNSGVTFNLSYDVNNNLLSLISTPGGNLKLLYTFLSNNKYALDLYHNDSLYIHENFYNNINLFLDSTYQYDIQKDTSSEKYLYNNLNQVTQLKEYIFNNGIPNLSNSISYNYNISGDLLSASGTDQNTESYTYYTDSSYIKPLIIGPANSASSQKFHLINTYTLTSNGSIVTSAQYTYTFDANKRISGEKQTYNDGTIVLKSYTYF